MLHRFPFVLILKEVKSEPVVQPLRVKIDPGSKVSGIAVVNDTTGEVVWAAELTHRGEEVHEHLTSRRASRRFRRQRHTRYREARWRNRRRPQGWLPPSLLSRIGNVLTWVQRLRRWCPVGALSLELVRFDSQLLQNPHIEGLDYQRGTLFGTELRQYLLAKWEHHCAYCAAGDCPLEIDHVQPRAKGGSDRVANLVIACHSCNQAKADQLLEEFLRGRPEVLARIQVQRKAPLNCKQLRNIGKTNLVQKSFQLHTGSLYSCSLKGSRMTKAYWFASRPGEVEHQHPFLVFDGQDQLHVPLTIFGKEALMRVSKKTVQGYLYAILPFFCYLENDVWQVRTGRQWNNSPHQVHQAVEDYLVQSLQCKVQTHRHGFQLVSITSGTHSTIRIFLSGLKLFYQVMYQREYYSFSNPLVDAMTTTIAAIGARLEHEDESPRMPEMSGVVDARPKKRLSDSYFKLTHEDWVPQIIDDPLLPNLIIEGGKKLPLKGRRLREECVTWILFESGARISEVSGLMLGDWVARGMLREADTFNKGSYGRRTKFLSFSHETVKLLKRYFDSERQRIDQNSYTLDDYLFLAKTKQVDLQTIPLFLSAQRTPLTPKEYREHY